jgi:glucose/mannose-6-phosphate isomerase
MNLDDRERFRSLDPQDMLGDIDRLPDQLAQGWGLGQSLPLPSTAGGALRSVVLAGMGGSAIGADLLAAYAAPSAAVPLVVWRGYEVPAFVRGPEHVVVLSSHSGNTEETLSAYDAARRAGASLMAVTTGGELAKRAAADGVPLWRFEHRGQPRAAVGYSFGCLLALVARLGILSDPGAEVAAAVASMKQQQTGLRAESPVSANPAKRLAGQLMDRTPLILGADLLAPVARRWRTQIAELAKALAQFEELPEADHNMLAGVSYPDDGITRTMALFLRAPCEHPRNLRRIDATRQVMMVAGFNTDEVVAAGEGRLAQQWTCLHFGDYTAYYLAMAYGVDPGPVHAIEDLKRRLG